MRLDLLVPELEEPAAECAVGVVETTVAAICSSRRDITSRCAVRLTAVQELRSTAKLIIAATPVLAVQPSRWAELIRIHCDRTVRRNVRLRASRARDRNTSVLTP